MASNLVKLLYTVFLLINAPRAMQNMDREPLRCTQFAKQKVCPILFFFFVCCRECLDEIINLKETFITMNY